MNRPDPDVNGAARPAVDGRQGRWTRHREERRAELVNAAIAAIRRYGADAGMEQIAAEAGVTKPVLYRYFADKNELWLAASELAAAHVVAAVAPTIAHIREERSLVAAAVDAYLAAIEAEPELYLFLLQRASLPGLQHLIANSAGTLAASLSQVMGDRLRALGLDSGPAEPWAYGMIGFVQSVGTWWLRRRQPITRAALAEYVTTALWDGVSGVIASADLPTRLTSTPAEGEHRVG
jgi:AcrR family transcriptional regulator